MTAVVSQVLARAFLLVVKEPLAVTRVLLAGCDNI